MKTLNEAEFREEVKKTFGLEFSIYKEKLAYWMIYWTVNPTSMEPVDGSVAGSFAGHGHNCRLAHFDYHGWVYAYDGENWYLQPDGVSGWRKKDMENPFPQFELKTLQTW